MNKDLENYLSMVIPQPLEDEEYIRLLLLFAKNNQPKQIFVKHFEEVEDAILKYKFACNIFISLSTYKKEPYFEKPATPYRRQVLFLDFDQKDFPGFKNASNYSLHLKSKIPALYNHCIVASGSGGYHYYIATETAPVEEIVPINKTLARIVEADIKAANSTQVARIPTSYNLKDSDNRKYVKLVSSVWGTEKCKPYTLARIKNMLAFIEQNNKIEIPEQEKSLPVPTCRMQYYCVEKMLALGCKPGERNFALGRIVAKLKLEHYQYDAAKQVVLGWNTRCTPPKSIQEVTADFDRYWNSEQYLLLGCNLPAGRQKDILEKYCDKIQCSQYSQYEIQNDTKGIITVSEKLLNKRNLRRLNGNHYLILFMLIASGNSLPKTKLKSLLNILHTPKQTKKLLKELSEYKLLEETKTDYRLKPINSKFDTKLRIKSTIVEYFLKSKISKTDFVVYLGLCVLLQTKNNATYDSLSEYLNKEKSSISAYINHLNQANIIKIDKIYNEKGLLCNRYTFL